MQAVERTLLARLGVPDDAERVLVLAETSHWDPNWLKTSEEYYAQRVRHTLDAALRELAREPRRVFSIECVFFLRMYWERNPDRRDALRDLLNRGRLRLTGTGVTTPDTTLPGAEAILRDYLLGARWLRDQGVVQEPPVAYLPDNFGNSPALPTLLRAMGYRYAAVSRIDGMHFVGDDFRLPGWYPRPGSSAELLRRLGSLDFRWRGPDGAQVLSHWNAFTYFQGDMLAWRGIIRWMNRVLGWSDRTAVHVGRKLESFARALAPLSATRYLLCPIGCDFNDPIPGLVDLLDRYNWGRYPRSGVFAVNAGLDDYLALVDATGTPLPVVDLDPNPYWMGFYASRPGLKQRVRRLARSLDVAERRLTRDLGPSGADPPASDALRRGWERLVVSNHHDYVTGTAPDRVVRAEQEPWIREAQEHADRASGPRAPVAPAPRTGGVPAWFRDGDAVEVTTPTSRVRLDGRAGGCITGWWTAAGGRSLVDGPSNDAVAYRDSGGLWRMGHEFAGGTFRPVDRASLRPAAIDVEPFDHGLRIAVETRVDGRRVLRLMWFRNDTPVVRMRWVGSAGRRRTVTCLFSTRLRPAGLDMDVPGGVVRRALRKGFDPTFWCASNFVHLRDDGGPEGLAVVLGGPASLSGRDDGRVEWVTLRNATRERAFGFLPVPAHPAWGSSDGEHGFDFAVWPTASGDWRENRLHVAAETVLWEDLPGSGVLAADAWEDGPARTDHDDVRVRAVKPAEDGRGVVVRLVSFARGPVAVRLALDGARVAEAVLCDALERDAGPLPVEDGRVIVPVDAGIVTVRLHPRPTLP